MQHFNGLSSLVFARWASACGIIPVIPHPAGNGKGHCIGTAEANLPPKSKTQMPEPTLLALGERPTFSFEAYLPAGLQTLRRPVARLIDGLLGLKELTSRYHGLPPAENVADFVRMALSELNIRTEFEPEHLARIPSSGPCVIVANHPHGGPDGLLLMDLLLRVRPDVRFVANHFLAGFMELRSLLLQVDPFGGGRAARYNVAAVRAARRWLDQGGLLVMFPGGEVSSLKWSTRRVMDPEWTPGVARLLRKTAAPALPIYIEGRNSLLFQVGGLLNPRLRTALLVREMLKPRTVRLRIGRQLAPSVLAEIGDDETAAQYLQYKTYLLPVAERLGRPAVPTRPAIARPAAPIAPALPSAQLAAEVAKLPPAQLLHAHGRQEIWYFTGRECPALLNEIGRLRELTFRRIGEGTGKPSDIDEYDRYYQHMFLWDKTEQQIIGGYRMGPSDLILASHGARGLYTHSLFRMSDRLIEKLRQGVELGRSFVRQEHQRSFTALLMLWRGIGSYVVQNPRYRYLFGPVSISNDYHPLSQQILISMLKRHKLDADGANEVRPRHPFRLRESELPPFDAMDDADSRVLADLIGTLEEDEKGVPVLLRQYLKLGGRMLGFNVDPAFNNVVDSLIIVDLMKSEPAILAKYFGEAGTKSLRAFHGFETPANGPN